MTHNHNRMDLPRLVVDRILLHLTDVDALYSVHMAKDALTTVIAMCPEEWRPELHKAFTSRTKTPKKPDSVFDPDQHRAYLLPYSVAQDIDKKYEGRKRAHLLNLTAMQRWLLNQHGSATAWKAAQLLALQKKSRRVWRVRTLMMAMPDVLKVLAKKPEVSDAVLSRLQSVDKPMRNALLAGTATAAARKRLFDFMLRSGSPKEDECRLLQRHLLSGDDAVEQEYLDMAIGKLAALSEDVGRMRDLLSLLTPDQASVMTKLAKEIGNDVIAEDLLDVTADYVREAERQSRQSRRALLHQIRANSDGAKWRMAPGDLEASGISLEKQEHAASWLDSAYWTWNHDGDPDQFVDTIKRYVTFEEALADDDIEPVVTPNGRADIVYDGVSLRQLSDETWNDLEHLISTDHDFDGAAELCQYVFFQFSELRAALQACGLEYRDDSELCRAYVERGEGELDKIVETMREMDFFAKSTEYKVIVSTLRDRRNHYRMNAHAESALAKKVALLRHTGEPPESLRALADDAVALQDANGIYEKIRATDPCSGRWNVCADCRDAYDISDSDESDDSSRDW